MARNKDISIRRIAQECGVSTATVSRVLNDPMKVSKETRERIQVVLQKYHYNLLKQTNPTSSLSTLPKIGIILPSSTFYYTELQQKITLYFMDQGISTIIYNIETKRTYLPTAMQALYEAGVLGIILISCNYHSIEHMLRPEIPCVWIDCDDPYEETKHILQVQTDHYVSGQLAAQELLNKGCRKPLILTSAQFSHRASDRRRGFENVLQKNNLSLDENHIVFLPFIKHHMIESRDIVQYLITKGEDFDSIFAINDWRSLGALMGVQNSGLRVPEDIRIIGFDGISIVCNMTANITSIQQNTELLALNACELLEKYLQGKSISERRIIVPPHLVVGQTT